MSFRLTYILSSRSGGVHTFFRFPTWPAGTQLWKNSGGPFAHRTTSSAIAERSRSRVCQFWPKV